MIEIKVEDILIPLLKNHYDEVRFNQIFNSVRKKNPKILYLEGGFGYSINFIHVENSKDLKIIENSLNKCGIFECVQRQMKLFSWDDIPGNDNKILIDFLNKRFGIDWVKTEKIDIINDDKTIKLSFKNNFVHILLNDETNNVSLKIDDGRTDEFIVKPEKGKLNIYQESLDDMFLNRGTDLFERKIFRSKKEIKIEMKTRECNIKEFSCGLFINIAEIEYNKEKDDTYHIISAILTSFNHSHENGKLCNKQIIKLVNSEQNGFESFSFPKDFPEEVKKLLKKDTFVAIQLWNHRWESNEDNTFDAKTYVKENPYYFYSILTLEEEVFRRTYENIMDVLGWCQSASSAYFDVFYGTTCLELTIKPKIKIFDETGHDSEEFRIWELLALQKKLLYKINQKNMDNVDDCIKELDKIYNFNIFTDKKGKGEKWIIYGEYLQKITGIDYDYQDYKLKKEMKDKEYEQKLQKLNILIIISIFISFLTLLLSPIYSSWVSTDINPSLNSTYSFYFEKIFRNPYREFKAIHLALIFTIGSYLYVFKIGKIQEIEKHLIIVLILIIVGLFFMY